jgi:hypothetical protein
MAVDTFRYFHVVSCSVRPLLQLAARQNGLFTRLQAHALDVNDNDLESLVGRGWCRRIRQGVYVVSGTPPSWEQEAHAVVLASGEGALACGPTAALLWAFPHAESDCFHVLVDAIRRPRFAGVVGHRSRLIVPADRRVLRGIPITSPARVIVDCSTHAVLARLMRWWMDHGLRMGWYRVSDLRHTIERMRPGPGRDLVRLRTLAAKLDPDYQPGASQPEVRIAEWLEAAGLGRPRLNVMVNVGRTRYEIDGLYVDEKVGFEYQSWDLHGGGQRRPFVRDARKLSRLTAAGYEIHPFTDETTEAEAVEAIGLSLRRRRHP